VLGGEAGDAPLAQRARNRVVHCRRNRTAAVIACATAADDMGFWPVIRFPSRRTFSVNGAATSTMAPSAASSS